MLQKFFMMEKEY